MLVLRALAGYQEGIIGACIFTPTRLRVGTLTGSKRCARAAEHASLPLCCPFPFCLLVFLSLLCESVVVRGAYRRNMVEDNFFYCPFLPFVPFFGTCTRALCSVYVYGKQRCRCRCREQRSAVPVRPSPVSLGEGCFRTMCLFSSRFQKRMVCPPPPPPLRRRFLCAPLCAPLLPSLIHHRALLVSGYLAACL